MKHFILILFLLSSFGSSAMAQDSFAEKMQSAHLKTKIDVQYDKFKDQTSLYSSRSSVKGKQFGKPARADFYLYGVFNGLDVTRPTDYFWMHMKFASIKASFQYTTGAIFLADGERIFSQGNPIYDIDVTRAGRTLLYVERLGFMLKRADVQKIGEAKKVELQVGGFEATLEAEEVNAFADMLKITEVDPE